MHRETPLPPSGGTDTLYSDPPLLPSKLNAVGQEKTFDVIAVQLVHMVEPVGNTYYTQDSSRINDISTPIWKPERAKKGKAALFGLCTGRERPG